MSKEFRYYCFISFWLLVWSILWFILNKFNIKIPNPYPIYIITLIPNIIDMLFELYKLYVHFSKKEVILIVIFMKILYHFVPLIYLRKTFDLDNIVHCAFILTLFLLAYKNIKDCDFDIIYSRKHLDNLHNLNIKKYIKMRYDIDI